VSASNPSLEAGLEPVRAPTWAKVSCMERRIPQSRQEVPVEGIPKFSQNPEAYPFLGDSQGRIRIFIFRTRSLRQVLQLTCLLSMFHWYFEASSKNGTPHANQSTRPRVPWPPAKVRAFKGELAIPTLFLPVVCVSVFFFSTANRVCPSPNRSSTAKESRSSPSGSNGQFGGSRCDFSGFRMWFSR